MFENDEGRNMLLVIVWFVVWNYFYGGVHTTSYKTSKYENNE